MHIVHDTWLKRWILLSSSGKYWCLYQEAVSSSDSTPNSISLMVDNNWIQLFLSSTYCFLPQFLKFPPMHVYFVDHLRIWLYMQIVGLYLYSFLTFQPPWKLWTPASEFSGCRTVNICLTYTSMVWIWECLQEEICTNQYPVLSPLSCPSDFCLLFTAL